jgi:hypothetical protein
MKDCRVRVRVKVRIRVRFFNYCFSNQYTLNPNPNPNPKIVFYTTLTIILTLTLEGVRKMVPYVPFVQLALGNVWSVLKTTGNVLSVPSVLYLLLYVL